ncbi:MAG: hypothetical protein IT537_30515 [Hyphomicrobiales bacterium]|nr:hypothetical protein [Hyphomicrobiales bacterium]
MKRPDARSVKLVTDLAQALADYHGERRGDFSCHVQAATILIEAGPLRGFEVSDFLKVEHYGPATARQEQPR